MIILYSYFERVAIQHQPFTHAVDLRCFSLFRCFPLKEQRSSSHIDWWLSCCAAAVIHPEASHLPLNSLPGTRSLRPSTVNVLGSEHAVGETRHVTIK